MGGRAGEGGTARHVEHKGFSQPVRSGQCTKTPTVCVVGMERYSLVFGSYQARKIQAPWRYINSTLRTETYSRW